MPDIHEVATITSKGQITLPKPIRQALGVDYGITVTCYQADDEGRACGGCEACRLRAAGFHAAGIADPTRYRPRSA